MNREEQAAWYSKYGICIKEVVGKRPAEGIMYDEFYMISTMGSIADTVEERWPGSIDKFNVKFSDIKDCFSAIQPEYSFADTYISEWNIKVKLCKVSCYLIYEYSILDIFDVSRHMYRKCVVLDAGRHTAFVYDRGDHHRDITDLKTVSAEDMTEYYNTSDLRVIKWLD
jgi:hypothetical protein